MKMEEQEKTKTTEKKIWLPVVIAFLFLCIIVWLDELIGLPGILIGGPKTSPNWREALEETIVIVAVGLFALFKLIRAINKRRHAEEELRQHQEHLEEMVRMAERSGCRVEIVDHNDVLMSFGGVGALLRYHMPA